MIWSVSRTGDQVPADAKVLEGSVEVNESLLTGESDNLPKNEEMNFFPRKFCDFRRSLLSDHPCWKGQLCGTDHK